MGIGFGKRLRAYRKEHNLTQRELAEMMDISPNHISVLEREEKLPRASTIAAFEALVAKDDLERYLALDTVAEVDLESYIKMMNALRLLNDDKKTDALKAISEILGLL